MSHESAKILQALRQKPNATFKLLYAEYFAMVKYFVEHNSGNKTDASDVFQDALIVLYEKSLEPNFKLTSTVKTYLYSVARNIWLKKLRNQKKQTKITDFEDFITVAEEDNNEIADNQATVNLVMQTLNQLGEKCRKLLSGFYFHKKTMNQLATELNYTNASNAKTQKYKCLQQLKKRVAEQQ